MKKQKAITLISLVITIIVLIILASVAIYLSLSNNGIFVRSKQAKEATNKQTATEIINLKITNCQMNKYEVGENPNSIYTKLEKYPYEFEINSSLQLASIDGNKLVTSNNNTLPKICIEQYRVVLLAECGGEGDNLIDKLDNYNTLTVGSRTRNRVSGTTYWRIIGYYEDSEGKTKTENILNTTSPSNVIETFNIEKYKKIMFKVVCTATGGSGWCSYYFKNIEIF